MRSGFHLEVASSGGGGIGACVESALAGGGKLGVAASPDLARHRVELTVSAEPSTNGNPSLPSAYGHATVTVDGSKVNLPAAAAKWTAFGATPEAALYNAKHLERLKSGSSMAEICRQIAESTAPDPR